MLLSGCVLYPPYRPLAPYALNTATGPDIQAARERSAGAVTNCHARMDSLRRDAYQRRRTAAIITMTSGAVSAMGGAASSLFSSTDAKTVGGIVSALGGIFTFFKGTADSDPEGVVSRAVAADTAWKDVMAAAVAYDTTGSVWLARTSPFPRPFTVAQDSVNRALIDEWSRANAALQVAVTKCN